MLAGEHSDAIKVLAWRFLAHIGTWGQQWLTNTELGRSSPACAAPLRLQPEHLLQ
jgi:hypothetical protein